MFLLSDTLVYKFLGRELVEDPSMYPDVSR